MLSRSLARGDRLDTLALTLSEQPQRVERERLASVPATEEHADAVEVAIESELSAAIKLVRHALPSQSREGWAKKHATVVLAEPQQRLLMDDVSTDWLLRVSVASDRTSRAS